MRLFLEQGYESVTVEAVADASRVSRRTVFRHYAGKKELPFPDHSERVALVERHLVEAGADADPVEAVIAATEASMRDFLGRPELVLRATSSPASCPSCATGRSWSTSATWP